jgi:hypothetical protein
MATTPHGRLVSEAVLEDLGKRAESIYEKRLKALLEPTHNNEFVAIHVESGDYAVGATFREAKRMMLARHSIDGKLVVMKIGPDPEIDYPSYRPTGPKSVAPRSK